MRWCGLRRVSWSASAMHAGTCVCGSSWASSTSAASPTPELGARRSSAARLRTGTARAYLIKVRSGRVRELAIEGFPEALGRRWIESVAQPPDCDRCGTIVYTNRLTRAQRRFDVNEPPDFDLDGATLRRPPGNSRQLAYHGRRWIEGRGRGSTERLWLRGDGSPRLVGACRPSCSVVDLTARHVSYADEGIRAGGTLHDVNLHTGERGRRGSRRRAYRDEAPLRVCSVPSLVSESWAGTIRLWRPPRAPSRC